LLRGPFHRRGPKCIWWNAIEVTIGRRFELVRQFVDGFDVGKKPRDIPGNDPEEERAEYCVEAR
jgi:hypothetical protein